MYTSPRQSARIATALRTQRRATYWVASLVGAFTVWWAAPLVRLASVDPVTAALWRFTVALAAFTLYELVMRKGRVASTILECSVECVVAGMLLALHMVLWFQSLTIIPVLPSTALVCTYPALLALIDVARREVELFKLLSVIPLAAATLIALRVEANPVGVILSLSSSLAVTAYFTLLRRLRRRGLGTTRVMLGVYMYAVSSLAFFAILEGRGFETPVRAVPYLVALGLGPATLGHGLLAYALRGLPASTVTGFILTEPLGASLLSYILLGDRPSKLQIAYSLLALVSSIIASTPFSKSRRG